MSLQQQPKLPPHSIQAEQSALGGMMIDNRCIGDIREILRAEDFYREDHRAIFAGIGELLAKRKPVDFLTLTEHFKAAGTLAEVGGLVYLAELQKETPSAANAIAYAEIVRERATLRDAIAACGAGIDACYKTGGEPVEEILGEIERSVLAVRARGIQDKSGPRDAAEVVEITERGIEKRLGGTGVSGLPTGLVDLDKRTTGLHPGDLVVVAGRPSMGKTSLAMMMVEHCSLQLKKPALVFSLEMPAEQLMQRVIASQARVPLTGIRSGDLTQFDWDRIGDVGGIIRAAPLRIDERGGLSPNAIRACARREKARKGGLGLIVIDYMQLMQIPGTKENRTGEMTQISRELKALAKELEVPVIALSQLNRGVEQRDNKRPRLSDLRESGGIEQDADLVLLIYRDEVYDENSTAAGTAEIIIGKQRNGPLGMVRTTFRGEFCRFENLAADWAPVQAANDAVTNSKPRSGWGSRSKAMSHAAHAAPTD